MLSCSVLSSHFMPAGQARQVTMSNYVAPNGYNLEALGAKNHLGTASDPYRDGHYPPGQTGRIHDITYPGQVCRLMLVSMPLAHGIQAQSMTSCRDDHCPLGRPG